MIGEEDFAPRVPDFGDVLAAAAGEGAVDKKESGVHIRIQQRNGRKSITTVSGLPESEVDFKKILTQIKKQFACNGSIQDDKDFGKVIQLQGDQRGNLAKFLEEHRVVAKDSIRVHGH
eukprot:TRINITY_DN925_c0_g1_i1.p1 TRINITY_DN925_c0_g1~~TRINITY_DN925_c0_g1_i1.p1  ORF type:complete len:118 (-),score=29.92 TRINITY_DN925_c0_g1_i1:312-665(-)